MKDDPVKHGTGIEWTHGSGYKGETWNPVVGCSKVSAGCRHCYAETVHKHKLSGRHGYPEFKPWSHLNAEHNVTLMPHRLDQPLRWQKPRMVFVNSMSDLFHELVPDDYILRVFRVMAQAPQHIFQVLTKRPDRMREFCLALNEMILPFGVEATAGFEPPLLPPLPNVWLGTSIENAKWSHRADELRATPAAIRFISAEPLLGPLVEERHDPRPHMHVGPPLDLDGIDWLIVGGESGPGHRPMREGWVRDLRDASRATGTAFFLKQLGGPRPGGKLEDLPEDLRIRELPSDNRVILPA